MRSEPASSLTNPHVLSTDVVFPSLSVKWTFPIVVALLPTMKMGAMIVVINFEVCKLSLQVGIVPEKRVVEKITTNSSDQPFDEGMR